MLAGFNYRIQGCVAYFIYLKFNIKLGYECQRKQLSTCLKRKAATGSKPG